MLILIIITFLHFIIAAKMDELRALMSLDGAAPRPDDRPSRPPPLPRVPQGQRGAGLVAERENGGGTPRRDRHCHAHGEARRSCYCCDHYLLFM